MKEKNKGGILIIIMGILAVIVVTLCAFNKDLITHKYYEYTIEKKYQSVPTNEYYLEDNFNYVENHTNPGIKNKEDESETASVGLLALFVQGIATSIDALSVGFTIADYGFIAALVCALIIAVVTFVICSAGLMIGKKFGTKLSNKATILGGVILIFIGIEIFMTGVF